MHTFFNSGVTYDLEKVIVQACHCRGLAFVLFAFGLRKTGQLRCGPSNEQKRIIAATDVTAYYDL